MEYIKRKNYICILLIIIFIFSCNNKNNENNISKLKKLLQDVSYLEIVDVIYEHFLNKTVIINISIFDNFDKKQEAINTGNIWIDHNSLVAIYKKTTVWNNYNYIIRGDGIYSWKPGEKKVFYSREWMEIYWQSQNI